MNRLFKAYALHYFGRDSLSPKRTAYIKLGILCLIALSTSWIICRTIANTTFHETTNDWITVVHLLVIMQIATFCLVLFGGGLLKQSSYRLLLALPVSRPIVWIIYMMPQLILLFVALGIFGIPLYLIATQVGLHPFGCLLSIAGALLSALSMLHSLPQKWNLARWIYVPAVLLTEALVLRYIQHGHDTSIWIILLLACVLTPIFLLPFGYRQIMAVASQNQHQKSVRFYFSPLHWAIAKGLRSNMFRTNIATSLMISIVLAAGMHTSDMADPIPASILAALLAGSVASDIRSLCAKDRPAEICTLRGTPHFIWQSMATYGLVILGTGPLLALIVLEAGSFSVFLQCAAFIAAGICIGHLSGAYFAPSQRDISAQCVTVFASSLLLWALLKSSSMITAEPLSQFFFILLGCIALSLLQFAIEYKRNPFTWRNVCFRKQNHR